MLLLAAPAHAQLAPASSPATSSASPVAQPVSPLALAPAPPTVRGRYLDAVPSILRTVGNATGGRQVTLAVDLAPKPSMRVYAPGNAGYTAVTLTIDEAGGTTAGAATKYPKAEEYLFAPLNERFKVYSAPFRLTRDVTVTLGPRSGVNAERGSTITGRLEYQACDDKVCYLPQTLPLTWTLAR